MQNIFHNDVEWNTRNPLFSFTDFTMKFH